MYFRTKWGTNKYTLGSYSFIKVGSSQKHILELQKPLKTPGFSKVKNLAFYFLAWMVIMITLDTYAHHFNT